MYKDVEGTSVARSLPCWPWLYHNIVCFGLLGEAWNSVIISRPKANAKLLLYEEKAEYGGEINDSVQESEDFVLVSQEIQASISLKHSVSYRYLLPKMSGGK